MGKTKVVEDFVMVIFGRADRCVFRRRECVFDESETAIRRVKERRADSDISAVRMAQTE